MESKEKRLKAISLRRKGWRLCDISKELDQPLATIGMRVKSVRVGYAPRGMRKPCRVLPTLEEAIDGRMDYLQVKNLYSSTREDRRITVRALHRRLDKEENRTEVTAQDMLNLMMERKKFCRPITIAGYLTAYRSFLSYVTSVLKIPIMDVHALPRVRVRRKKKDWIKPENMHKFLAAIKDTDNPARNAMIIELILTTGMRVSEACSITRDQFLDADPVNGRYAIKITGKFWKERFVFISSELRLRILKLRQYPDGYPFRHKLRGPLTTDNVRRLCTYICDLAQIDQAITPHLLRHYYLTYLVNETKQLDKVAELAGHSNIETTWTYLHPDKEALAKISRIMDQNFYHKSTFQQIKQKIKNWVKSLLEYLRSLIL